MSDPIDALLHMEASYREMVETELCGFDDFCADDLCSLLLPFVAGSSSESILGDRFREVALSLSVLRTVRSFLCIARSESERLTQVIRRELAIGCDAITEFLEERTVTIEAGICVAHPSVSLPLVPKITTTWETREIERLDELLEKEREVNQRLKEELIKLKLACAGSFQNIKNGFETCFRIGEGTRGDHQFKGVLSHHVPNGVNVN